MPEEWTAASRRRRAAGVPPEVHFQRKWELALELLDEAIGWGVHQKLVLADSGYSTCREFREELRARGLHFLVAVQGNLNVWPPGARPQLPQRQPHQMGRPRTRYVDESGLRPVLIEQLAKEWPHHAFHPVRWRQGSRGVQSSRFAAVRVHTAEHHFWRASQ